MTGRHRPYPRPSALDDLQDPVPDPEPRPAVSAVVVFLVLLAVATHGLAFLAGWLLR